MMAAIREGLGMVVEALLDKGASVHLKSWDGDRVRELGEGNVSRSRVLTYVLFCAVGW